MKDNSITLGGRTFVKLTKDSTVQHDLWLMQRASEAGLTTAQIWSGETPEAYAARLLDMAIKSGTVLEMLGGLLLPEGKKPEEWTPEMAVETGKHLGHIRDPDEKKAVNGLILSLLIDFFSIGLISRRNSISSSAQDQPGQEQGAAAIATANGAG